MAGITRIHNSLSPAGRQPDLDVRLPSLLDSARNFFAPPMFKANSVWLILLLGNARMSHAGRPLAVDDAGTVAPGQVELEVGVGHARDGTSRHWDFPLGLTIGLTRGLDVGIGTGGQIETLEEFASGDDLATGVRDLVVRTKWNFITETNVVPGLALAFTLKLPTANRELGLGSGEVDYDLTGIVSKRLGGQVNAHFNVCHSWLGDPSGKTPRTNGITASRWDIGSASSANWWAKFMALPPRPARRPSPLRTSVPVGSLGTAWSSMSPWAPD